MTNINEKLVILYDLLVDNFATLEAELKDLISTPDKIENTNRFASFLTNLNKSTFIDPLLLAISLSEKGDPWLTDFLYAAINLLDENSADDEFEIPENLIGKLQVWVIDNKGELAWKAANLLKYYDSESAEEIQLKKLEERDDFFLTYAECILGLLRYNKDKHWELVRQISTDETRDEELRVFAEDVINSYR
jgi:site-specific DNA-adenine methylase